jgi:MFS family permease
MFTIYYILYIPVSVFIGNYLMAKKGVNICLLLASILFLITLWLRTLINYNFYVIIIANIFSGCGQPLLLNAPAKVSSNWFSPNQRPLATTLLTLAKGGTAIGMLIPPIFLSPTKDPFIRRNQIFNASLFVAILFTGIILLSNALYKDKPPTPPR